MLVPPELKETWIWCDRMASLGHFAASFPEVQDPDVSIIIPVHNQLAFTLGCLDSIARHGAALSYEVILVDDASDSAVFLFLSQIKGVRVVRNFGNLGFVLGCNRGAFLARGRYLVFLNNDTVVTTGWLDSLFGVFCLRPDAGLVGAKLLHTDGSMQEAGGIIWQDGSGWNFGRNQDPALPAFNYLRETDYCSGACLMIPAALWRDLGGFDEMYAPAYYEDTDLAFRVRQAGRKVYYQPKSVVIHHEGKSNGTDLGSGLKSYQVRNRELFRSRWQSVLESAHHPNAVDVFRARERSSAKKVILIIDHYVPHFDKDAGSRSMMSYIQFLVAQGFSVKFIGDNHFPHQPYTDQLEAMGVEVLVGRWFAENYRTWFMENGRYIDYVFLSRAHTSRRWLALIHQNIRAPILFIGVDLLSRTLERAAVDLGDPSFSQKARAYAEHENILFSQSDWIFYPSEDEVAELRKRLPDKRIVRIPLLAYGAPDRSVANWAAREGLLFVGGFGHTPNLDAVKWFVSAIWPRIRMQIPGISFTIVGSNPPTEIMALASDNIKILADATDAELAAQYGRHRLAVVPIRYGGGIKGKVLEAFHRGVPVVGTLIAAEGIAETSGYVTIAGEDDFAAKIAELYSNEAAWRAQQEAAWQFIADQYSARALARSLADAIPEILTVSHK